MSNETYVKYAKALRFRPVAPIGDAALLIRWGRDLYRESLGREDAFFRDYGPYGAGFPKWIATCRESDPAFAALLVEERAEIGLAVLGYDSRAELGRVHHFYVRLSHRGQGFGGLLDDYARDTLRGVGARRARLNVAAGNERAIRFYTAQGWRETGRRGGLIFMESAV